MCFTLQVEFHLLKWAVIQAQIMFVVQLGCAGLLSPPNIFHCEERFLCYVKTKLTIYYKIILQ